ncbi:MAG TPA: PfkB family carbohydrate kinase [Anaerolineae bacterium]|nr:PfkB family carbohydrate kinase [Anaerolineae bacterium]
MLYLAIGHVCQDVVPGGYALGGSVTYATLTARTCGWSVAAITRASSHLDLSPLGEMEWVRLPSGATTTFENIYTPSGRIQILHATAGPIGPGDVPRHLRRADVVHLAPIADEVDAALVDVFDGAWIGVTPQGWMRQWDASGRVSRRMWTKAESILARADATVLGLDDVGGDWDEIERWAAVAHLLVVTQGPAGCTVFERGASAQVPGYPTTEVDPTGAGDIFATAFFTQLRDTGDALLAARFANCVAAHSVTRRGLAGVPTAAEVQQCLAVLNN